MSKERAVGNQLSSTGAMVNRLRRAEIELSQAEVIRMSMATLGCSRPEYAVEACAGIGVCCTPRLDGGGARTWPHFVRAVREHIGPVGHAYEWCSGPGYIGFALLASGLCERLTLADINPTAVDACRETIRRNGLEGRVNVYLSDNLTDIPPAEVWDLVIGDPPHFPTPLQRQIDRGRVLRSVDHDWSIHRAFFRDLPAHLRPGSRLLLSESRAAGDHDDLFIGMIREAGLEMVEPVWELADTRRYCLHARMPDGPARS